MAIVGSVNVDLVAAGGDLGAAAGFAVAAGACAIRGPGARGGMPTETEVRAVLGVRG